MKTLFESFVKFIKTVKENKPESFFTMFDGGRNFKEARDKANRIFNRLFFPFAEKYLNDDVSKMNSLDIGYGSGFQVFSASNKFFVSYGIDLHGEPMYVLRQFELNNMPTNNLNLLCAPAHATLFSPNSVNFIHSWVTFLHFPTIEYTKKVLSEIFRVLRPKGVAVIYYPRLIKSKSKQTLAEYEEDIKLESKHEKGFEEKGILTPVFKKGISISRWKMTELVKEVGFELLEHTCSNDGGFVFGQHGIVIRKPAFVESKKPRLKLRKKSIKKED